MKSEDILHREQFVNQTVKIIEKLSQNSASTSFAINGTWGSGKSFVLDLLEDKLCNLVTAEKEYCIIRYNCWENDYYDEPLLALISSTITSIWKKLHMLPQTEKTSAIKGVLKATIDSLITLSATIIKEKTGIELDNAIELVRKGIEYGDDEFKEITKNDKNYYLKNNLIKLAASLNRLSTKCNIVIIVDELDRCLPEYAIKVLERLHHLTSHGQIKIVTIVSIDKEQLIASFNKIFGYKNPEKYLEKFFSFELVLNNGRLSVKFWEKYHEYLNMFDKSALSFNEPVDEFIKLILDGITIRKQEQIVHKAMLVHNLLDIGTEDYVFLCMELLLAVNKYEYFNKITYSNSRRDTAKAINNIFSFPANESMPKSLLKLREKVNNSGIYTPRDMPGVYCVPKDIKLYAAIALAWTRLFGVKLIEIRQGVSNSEYNHIVADTQKLKSFQNLLGYLH